MSPSPLPDAVTALLLAGGQGARMGGVDKGWVALAGAPLAERVAARLRPQADALLISANRNRERYAALGQVVEDAAEFAGCGPLAGLEAGLAACRTRWLLSVPCDLPFLPTDLAERLLRPLRAGDAALAVACCAGQTQPVCMALSVALLPSLRDYLRAGGRRVREWQRAGGALQVAFDDVPDAFRNINGPEELAAAERYASQRAKS
ncbi:molybdenum cofactor guanylyltransferase [Chromobacterium sp. ATCC 53434]|uniref:molybdenum cofactor guanylyltransferase MobA n=1 Tax=Chromobacterium sp. (strain ATCC 53434 / SC 14030) TaxID=2059672 RepID=UPI000C779705|nr:molybdenum cofactor guanylyltransferase MobA [Chromobacterium sp. ATCC 53434]AUH51907.1 molybdenum cofactor guanylyltransferase [Chromobacterium sp. ATCC 53434]